MNIMPPFTPSPGADTNAVLIEARAHAATMRRLYRESDRSTARLLRCALDHINNGRTHEAVTLIMQTIDTLDR